MPVTALRGTKAAIDEVFDDCRILVRRIAHRFARKYNQPFDEVYAQACLIFCQAYHTFDAAQGSIQTRLQFVIYNWLLDWLRPQAKFHAHLKRVPIFERERRTDRSNANCGIDAYYEIEDPLPFDPDVAARVQSDDARFLITLVFDTPDDLTATIRALPKPTRAVVRETIKTYLIERLKWDRKRVNKAFWECMAALD